MGPGTESRTWRPGPDNPKTDSLTHTVYRNMWLGNTYYNFRYSANMLNIRTQCQWFWGSRGSMGSWSTGGPGGLRGPGTGSYFSTMPLKTISSSLWIAFLLIFGKLTLWCLVLTKGLTYITKKIQVQSLANVLQCCKFHRKTPVSEPLFTGLQIY